MEVGLSCELSVSIGDAHIAVVLVFPIHLFGVDARMLHGDSGS